MIDLRSDTVTKPTAEMREVMAGAEVGDDVLGDDPTVKALEQRTGEILGKQGALYVPSGTMANQIAIRAHTEPGDEIILDGMGHSYLYEGGGSAALSGVTCRLIPTKRGIFTGDDVRAVLRPSNVHFPRTKLVCVENTHNRGGGSIWTLEQIADVEQVARKANFRMHLDGARLWNASAATGIPECEFAKPFDSVAVCFSKGLGAPVGSALAGNTEFIERARRFRKMFGGGMRQGGIIAAGALYALDHHRERLTEDHANASDLGKGLCNIPGIEVDLDAIETNMVYFRVTSMSAQQLVDRLRERGVGVLATSGDIIRAVTNLMVSADDMSRTTEIVRSIMQQC